MHSNIICLIWIDLIISEKLNSAIGDIRKRYGKNAVFRACFLNHESPNHMSGGIGDMKLTGMTKPMYHNVTDGIYE